MSFRKLYPVQMEPDTIYQYDTVFEYFIVYDTVFIGESEPNPEIMINNTDNAKQDTLETGTFPNPVMTMDSLRKYVNLTGFKLNRNKTVKDLGTGTKQRIEEAPEPDKGKLKEPKTKAGELLIRRFTEIPFAFYVADTLFYSDTVLILESSTDTSFFFHLSPKTDTAISRKTYIRNRPNLVIVNEVVSISVKNKTYVLVDHKPVKSFYQPVFEAIKKNPDAGIIKTSNYLKSKNHIYKKTLKNRFKTVDLTSANFKPGSSPHNGFNKSIDQYLFLKTGGTVLFPKIWFHAVNPEYESNTELLNHSTNPDLSYATGGGLIYYRNNWGIESGMSFSVQHFKLNTVSLKEIIETTLIWEEYDSVKIVSDTTWYIDINHWLATGDTILIPSVYTDTVPYTYSKLTPHADTSYKQVKEDHRLSFSFFEVPVIFRYPVLNGRLFCDAAAGVIPVFLYSRAGKMISPATGELINASDISFDYNVNLSVYGALSFGYKLSGKWAVLAESCYRKTVVTGLKNQQFRMKTDSWGIQIALTFRL